MNAVGRLQDPGLTSNDQLCHCHKLLIDSPVLRCIRVFVDDLNHIDNFFGPLRKHAGNPFVMEIRERRIEKRLGLHYAIFNQVIDDSIDEGDLVGIQSCGR